jgi:hypothetical protein
MPINFPNAGVTPEGRYTVAHAALRTAVHAGQGGTRNGVI